MDSVNLILLSLLGGALGLIGGVLFLYNQKLSHLLQKYSVSFASGVLITVSIFGLMPESFEELGETAFLIAAISFVLIFIFEKVFFGLHHHDQQTGHRIKKSSSIFVVIGDTIHNFIDGVSIAAGYLISPGLGLINAISSFLHEIPHEVGDFGILLKAGWRKGKILLVNLASSLLTVAGSLFVYFYTDSEIIYAALMSVSAGIFFYLGAIDFMPKFERKDFKSNLSKYLPFLIGALSVVLILNLIPHEH